MLPARRDKNRFYRGTDGRNRAAWGAGQGGRWAIWCIQETAWRPNPECNQTAAERGRRPSGRLEEQVKEVKYCFGWRRRSSLMNLRPRLNKSSTKHNGRWLESFANNSIYVISSFLPNTRSSVYLERLRDNMPFEPLGQTNLKWSMSNSKNK